MYVDFFRLRELPFNNTPDPRFFFPTSDHEEALASLIYAVKERKGFVLLTGEVGAGKTLVSRLMLRHFGSTIAFANVNHGVQTGRDLLEAVCAEFELDISPSATPTQLVRVLHDFLLDRFAQDVPVVLVLDEAQNLPVDAFEQLRMIGNLEADDAKLLQIAIVGQPELQTLFASRELRQLRQRLFRSFHLPALSEKNTKAYIRHRLNVAGSQNPDLFTHDAVERIQKSSHGLPRLINTICDNAMLSAYSADRQTIDDVFVASVIEQMLPVDDVSTVTHDDLRADPVSTFTRIRTDSGNLRRGLVPTERADEAAACSRSAATDRVSTVARVASRPQLSVREIAYADDAISTASVDGIDAAPPDRTGLLRSARKELDALRAALHGPLRGVSMSRADVHAGSARLSLATPRSVRERTGYADAAPRGADLSDVDGTAQRLQVLVERAERSSTALEQREEKLRTVVNTVEGLAANLRGLLSRYHRTMGSPDVRATRAAPSTQAAAPNPHPGPPGRDRQQGRARSPSDVGATSLRTANLSTVSETPRDPVPSNLKAATAAIRAQRLARTLRATRANLSRLRSLAPKKK